MPGEDDLELRVTANVDSAEKVITRLYEKMQSGAKLTASDMARLQIALDAVDKQTALAGDDAGKYAAQLVDVQNKAAAVTQEYERQAAVAANVKAEHAALTQELGRQAKATIEAGAASAATVSRLEELGNAVDAALAKGPRGAKAAQIALDQLDKEITDNGARWRAAGADVDFYNKKLDDGRAKNRAAIQQLDDANKKLAAQKISLDDLGRAAGLPVGELGQLALVGSVAVGTLQDLKKVATELIDKMGGSAEETKVLKEAVNALLDPSHFLLHTWNAIIGTFGQADAAIEEQAQAWADLLVKVDEAPAVYARASAAAVENLERVRGVIKARADHKAAMLEEVAALEATIRAEENQNGVSEDSRREAEALVKKYGDDIPAAFLTTVDAIGKSTAALDAEREAAIRLGHEGFEDLVKRTDESIARFTTTRETLDAQTFAIEESIGHLKLLGKVTKEESDKVVAAVLDQLDAYRSVGEDIPEDLAAVALEWVNLDNQTKAGAEATRERVAQMVAAYDEAGEKVPAYLQKIVDRLGDVAGAQSEVSEGVKRILEAVRETDEELRQGTDDLIESVRILRDEGHLTAEVAEDMLARVVDQLNAYRRLGEEVPPELADLAYELGAIVGAQKRLTEEVLATADAYEAQAEAGASAVEILDAIKAATEGGADAWQQYGEAVTSAFEGLPDDGTTGPGAAPAQAPSGPGSPYYDAGYDRGHDFGTGLQDGAEAAQRDSGGGGGLPGAPAGGGGGPFDPGRLGLGGAGGDFIVDPRRPLEFRRRHFTRPLQQTHAGRAGVLLAPYALDTSLSPDGFVNDVLHVFSPTAGLSAEPMSEAMAAANGPYYEGPVVVTLNSFAAGPVQARYYENATGYLVGAEFFAVDLGTGGDVGHEMQPGFGPAAANPGAGLDFAGGLARAPRPAPRPPAGGGSPGNKQVQLDDALRAEGPAIVRELQGLRNDLRGAFRGDGGAGLRLVGGL